MQLPFQYLSRSRITPEKEQKQLNIYQNSGYVKLESKVTDSKLKIKTLEIYYHGDNQLSSSAVEQLSSLIFLFFLLLNCLTFQLLNRLTANDTPRWNNQLQIRASAVKISLFDYQLSPFGGIVFFRSIPEHVAPVF